METNQQSPAIQTAIGFLGYREFDDGAAYRGAILVTDEWSKPLEFRCTAPVRPTQLQRTLYGKSLLPHVLTELIAAPLISSIREKPQLILIADDAYFDVRHKISAPVIRVARPGGAKARQEDQSKTKSLLLRKLTRSRPLRTEDCLASLMVRYVVSDDLHKPLARHARADGKRYTDKTQMPDKTPGVDKLQTPELAFVGEGLGNRKAFEQERGRVTRGMSVWDLLLPLLQRPVNLDLGTVVELPSNLYPYQTKGVEFLLETPSALLGDDMGTGKTVQTSVALRMLFQTGKIRTALIVCPLSVIPNWDRELAKWAGNLAVTVVRGDKEHRKICWQQAAHVWLVTYDTLRNDIDHVLISRKGGFDLVVLDEAQRVKNWSAGITRAVRTLRATYRWGLTGTPLENNTDELWTILNVLKPDISQGQLDWSEGIRSVLRPMFLRRRKQDVLTDLPRRRSRK